MEPDIELVWGGCEREDWDGLLARAPFAALPQTWGYGAALAQTAGCRVRRCVVLRRGRPRALAQVFEKNEGMAVYEIDGFNGETVEYFPHNNYEKTPDQSSFVTMCSSDAERAEAAA